jgi:hypothetical protein
LHNKPKAKVYPGQKKKKRRKEEEEEERRRGRKIERK